MTEPKEVREVELKIPSFLPKSMTYMCEANLSSFQKRLKTELIFELLPTQERNSLLFDQPVL